MSIWNTVYLTNVYSNKNSRIIKQIREFFYQFHFPHCINFTFQTHRSHFNDFIHQAIPKNQNHNLNCDFDLNNALRNTTLLLK
nr:hypothetical protein [Bacillus sp. AR2-1]